MTERNATCSGCGEAVLVEANGQKDGTCACDATCYLCGTQFAPWWLENESSFVPPRREHICETCYLAFRAEYITEHRMEGLWANLTADEPPLYPPEAQRGYALAKRLARLAFELHVLSRAEDGYWEKRTDRRD